MCSISGTNGRDKPMGTVQINSQRITHIDGSAVIVGGHCIFCSLTGIKKVYSALGLEGDE